jgi:nitrilase
MDPVRVAAVQMVSGPDVAENLAAAGTLLADAAARGARLVALPENFGFMGHEERDKLGVVERDGDGPMQAFLAAAAREHGVWLVGGSVPLASDDPDRVYNTCLVFDDTGTRVARYDKIHLFSFQTATERYDEARTVVPGNEPVAIATPYGRAGLTICYDLRFPELFRALGTCDFLFVPAAFTFTTGGAHWETLLRARAIENLAWVVAPAQGGRHASGRRTWGHTMIIDPWGVVRAVRSDEGPGVIVADLDPNVQARSRTSLPALQHRRL